MQLTKYPHEVYSAVRDQTFAATSELTRADSQAGREPLKVYDDFSRIVFSIINKDKKVTLANVPIWEIANIREMTRIAQKIDTESALQDKPKDAKPADTKGAAYTFRIPMGRFKGKTPAEVLTEDAKNRETLLAHQAWLKQNIGQYPQNQTQIDAITEAIQLMEEGRLASDGTSTEAPVLSSKSIVLYDAKFRPLVRRKRPNGKCFVYEITFTWRVGSQYPVEAVISNYWAPVIRNESGLLNVKASEAEDRLSNTMSLMAKEWNCCLDAIERNMRQFEFLYAKQCFSEAKAVYDHNVQATAMAKAAASNN